MMTAMVTVRRRAGPALLCCCCSSVCVTATGDDNNDNSRPPSPELGKPDPTKICLVHYSHMVGETVVPQTESGRDSEEGLRSPGPSLPKEAGTAITGQTRVPPESLSSASDNPEPAGLATQSPHTHKVRPVCQMHKIKGAVKYTRR
ncbi:mucin-like glycoprotein [Trypanosoma cruzi cruzi]|nr:mucin-like glycoprotein [Trypanosoma cruzi cruzi]